MNDNASSNGSSGPQSYRFDRFSVNERNGLLLKDGEEVPLTPKVLDVLLVFLANPGRVLEKEELIEKVWDTKFVEEGNLARNISTLRKALGGDAHDHRYVVTVPGRGYRFVAEVSTSVGNGSTTSETNYGHLAVLRRKPILPTASGHLWMLLVPLISLIALGVWFGYPYLSRVTNATSRGAKPANPEARQAYITGKYLFQMASDKAGTTNSRPLLMRSIEYYEQALRIEPDFAPLYADYAKACHWLAGTGYRTAYYNEQARDASRKAIELDDTLSDAHGALAFNTYNYKHDLKGAEKEYIRALDLDSNSEFRHSHAMNLAMLGRIDEAVSEIEIALRNDPSQITVRQNAGRIYLEAGHIDRAVEQFKNVVDLAPQNPIGYAHLGIAQVIAGQYDEGIANIQKFLQTESDPGDRAILGWALAREGRRSEALAIADELAQKNDGHVPAMIYSGLGENEKALTELERVCAPLTRDLTEIRISPFYFNLKDEPRFQELIRKLDAQTEI